MGIEINAQGSETRENTQPLYDARKVHVNIFDENLSSAANQRRRSLCYRTEINYSREPPFGLSAKTIAEIVILEEDLKKFLAGLNEFSGRNFRNVSAGNKI